VTFVLCPVAVSLVLPYVFGFWFLADLAFLSVPGKSEYPVKEGALGVQKLNSATELIRRHQGCSPMQTMYCIELDVRKRIQLLPEDHFLLTVAVDRAS
jgi:hypothetical protein